MMYDLYKYVFSFALSFSRMLCPKIKGVYLASKIV